jgi:hypothetical protein
MSRILSSHSLLRGISDEAREILMLTKPYRPLPVSDICTENEVLLHLPDVQSPVQYLIDMGLNPSLATHISSVYMEFIARHRQVFKFYFRRIIRGGCHLQPEYYRDSLIIQFRGMIQVWGSQIMSTARIWLCRAGLHPTASHPQGMDVSAILQHLLPRINLA